MDTPLIFLAFANDQDAHLFLLKEESRQVFAALEEPDRKEYIKVYREESAKASDIFQGFTRYKDRMAIFHYGGHASGTQLRLEEGAGNADGLAALMGEQENLKLVFLNGCSSKGQVKALLAAGVKAVIATSVPINDRKAMEFAKQFYEAMAHRRTIGQAFKLAEAYLRTRYEETEQIQQSGIMDFSAFFDTGEKELPWGLYYQEVHKQEILNWKLPYYRPLGLPKDMIQYIGKSFSANRYIMLVLDEMCKYNPDIYAQMVEQVGGETRNKDSKYYPEIIIRNLPWPIGSQIRLLRVSDSPNLERLEHLISTYVMTGQLLYYILVSDLWDRVRNGEIVLPQAYKTGLPIDQQAYLSFDFWGRIVATYEQFSEQGVAPFVPEFEMIIQEWKQSDSSMRKAHAFLEDMRAKLLSDPPTADMDKVCLQTEQAVAIMLKKAAFLARYRMLTIRNISIEQPRLRELSYELDMGALNALEEHGLGMYNDANNRKKSSYTNSQSIVLVANEDRIDDSLNLSPFVVDKHTYVLTVNTAKKESNKLANIYLLSWEEEERLHYLSVEHRIHSTIKNETEQDQLHTDIRASMYMDGIKDENLGVGNDFEDDPFGDDPFAAEEEQAGEDDTPKVFELLKEEFDVFKTDLALGIHA
ncbi:MAG: CHAT domain-containing protein [Bacteroidota bacterium]